MLCFSYGSNMSLDRLRSRVPSAQFVAVANLRGHRLRFHKLSRRDHSAKCDAVLTGNPDDLVIGVVSEIADNEKRFLDRAEGLGTGYGERQVEVETWEGEILRPTMYFATSIDVTLKPYDWYKRHVLIGAMENNLPAEYIARIESVEAKADPDRERYHRELSIHRRQ